MLLSKSHTSRYFSNSNDSIKFKFSKLQSAHTIITKQDYKVINDIIDEITIRYVKSKILRMKVH